VADSLAVVKGALLSLFAIEFALTTLRNPLDYGVQYAIEIFIDIHVCEPQEFDAVGFDVSLALVITFRCTWMEVAFSVDLNGKFERRAIEVNHVLIDTVLAPKFLT
jgi:hypothetical protein